MTQQLQKVVGQDRPNKPIDSLGDNKQKIPYLRQLRDSQNNKTYLVNDKEQLFRDHWTKIFSSDDDENGGFDYDHTTEKE